MDDRTKLIAGTAVAGGLYLALTEGTASGGTQQQTLEQRIEQLLDPIESWLPTTPEGDGPGDTPNTADEGEVGVSGNGVTYDDPESGQYNDEAGDDTNATFEDINNNGTTADNVDPTSYAPDDGGTRGNAPSGGVVSDPGTSQNYGSAPEAADDDLSERAANSNLQEEWAEAFDRLANYDSAAALEGGY